MKNNFTQALKELTGFDSEPSIETSVREDIISLEEVINTSNEEKTHITSTMVIKGDCDVKTFAKMKQSAYLFGNVIADDLETEQGAKIIGTITTRTGDLDLDSDFDFGGEF